MQTVRLTRHTADRALAALYHDNRCGLSCEAEIADMQTAIAWAEYRGSRRRKQQTWRERLSAWWQQHGDKIGLLGLVAFFVVVLVGVGR